MGVAIIRARGAAPDAAIKFWTLRGALFHPLRRRSSRSRSPAREATFLSLFFFILLSSLAREARRGLSLSVVGK